MPKTVKEDSKDNKDTQFYKDQLIEALKYKYSIDLLRMYLDEDKTYTIDEAEKIIIKELKREVN